MSRKQFTEEQQQKLRQNPYVYSITATRLSFTREFKELFMEACRAGGTSRKPCRPQATRCQSVPYAPWLAYPEADTTPGSRPHPSGKRRSRGTVRILT